MSATTRRQAFAAAATQTVQQPARYSLWERARAVPRMLGDTVRGTYRGSSVGKLALYALAVAYLLSPIDLVPEGFLLMFGLADDVLVAGWLFANVSADADAYLTQRDTDVTVKRDDKESSYADADGPRNGSGSRNVIVGEVLHNSAVS